MNANLEQRYALKFCFSAGFSATKAYELLKTTYKMNVMSCASAFRWYNSFASGREDVHDEQRKVGGYLPSLPTKTSREFDSHSCRIVKQAAEK